MRPYTHGLPPICIKATRIRLLRSSSGSTEQRPATRPGAILPQIQCPVLLLQADPAAGGLMTNAEVEQALHLLARPSHVQLEGVSHALHHIHPAPVAAAIKAFLQSC